ncbi:MAG TPA: type II CAAX endopeptidase family protein [Verrucomicrobiae bacterium]|nr:type II CAAX endopeptidase family protein [Verrucomicrobiae bacterium]
MLNGKRGNKAADRTRSPWPKLPLSLLAILSGLLLTVVTANVWPLLLLKFGMPLAAFVEAAFLGLFLWWTSGGGPPRSTKTTRVTAFRGRNLSSAQWFWGLVGAFFFAATIHASLVLLFRLVPFPIAAFRQGYDLSFIPSQSLRWLAIVFSALSAGICEEIGFRGYTQRPIEQRHGAPVAILISSLLFMALHLSKAWAIPGMVPIVFGAGVLVGLLAWCSGSLIPGIIGHVVMDIGLFAYWWTGIAGNFTARTIAVTGVDGPFLTASAVFVISLGIVLLATLRLRALLTLVPCESAAG